MSCPNFKSGCICKLCQVHYLVSYSNTCTYNQGPNATIMMPASADEIKDKPDS